MRRLKIRLVAAAIVLLGVATACSSGANETASGSSDIEIEVTVPTRVDDGVLSIGVFLPITGSGAALGAPMIEAIESAVVVINASGGVLGDYVRLTLVDEGAVAGFDDLIAAGVDAIVGPASSLVALGSLDATVRPGSAVVTCSPSASALALDDYPDSGYFFRTIPSDSLQMAAIAKRAERTGASTIGIGFLDDPYGRALSAALSAEVEARDRMTVVSAVGVDGDEEDLTDAAAELLAGEPDVVVVLGDSSDGSRLLVALDLATAGNELPAVIVNDEIRGSRATIQSLTREFRENLTGVAALARSISSDGPSGFFTAHAVDCVNLLAIAAVQAGSDSPTSIQANMVSASDGGRGCSTFVDCAELIKHGLQIDFNGQSGSVDLSISTGDTVRAWFEAFGFDEAGADVAAPGSPFEVP